VFNNVAKDGDKSQITGGQKFFQIKPFVDSLILLVILQKTQDNRSTCLRSNAMATERKTKRKLDTDSSNPKPQKRAANGTFAAQLQHIGNDKSFTPNQPAESSLPFVFHSPPASLAASVPSPPPPPPLPSPLEEQTLKLLLWNYKKHRLAKYLVAVEFIAKELFDHGIHFLIEYAVDAKGNAMEVKTALRVLAIWLIREKVVV